MKQAEFHPGDLVMVQVPVHPLLLKNNKSEGYTSTMQAKYSQEKTLPQDYLLRLCGQSFLGMTQSRDTPQQCLPPPRLGLALTDRL